MRAYDLYENLSQQDVNDMRDDNPTAFDMGWEDRQSGKDHRDAQSAEDRQAYADGWGVMNSILFEQAAYVASCN